MKLSVGKANTVKSAMGLTIWLLNVGTDVKEKPVLKVPGTTNSSAPTEMKRAKHLDNLTKRVLLPEVDQKRGKGAIQIKPEESLMIMKIETLKLQPQEKIMMITGLMMRNK